MLTVVSALVGCASAFHLICKGLYWLAVAWITIKNKSQSNDHD